MMLFILVTHFDSFCRYSGSVAYDAAYDGVKSALMEGFFGPADKGVYSPSVQYTLYQMASIAFKRCAI